MALSTSSLYVAFRYEGERPKYLSVSTKSSGAYLLTRNIVWNGVLNTDEYYEAYEIASGDSGAITETQFLQCINANGNNSVWLHDLNDSFNKSDITAYYGTGCELWYYSGNTTTQQVYIQGSGYQPVTIYLFTVHEFFPVGENGWIDSSTSLVGTGVIGSYAYKREYKNTLQNPQNTSREDTIGFGTGESVRGTIIIELFHNPGQLANTGLGLGVLNYSGTLSGTGPISNQTGWFNSDKLYDFTSAIPCGTNHSPIVSGGPARKVFAYHSYNTSHDYMHVAYTGQATNATISDYPSHGYYSCSGEVANNWVEHTAGDGRKYFGITVTSTSLHTYATIPVKAGKIYTFNMHVYSASTYHGIIISNAEVSNTTGSITSLGLARITGANSGSTYEYNCTSNGTIYIYFHTSTTRSLVGPSGSTVSVGDVEVIEEDAPVPSNITITLNKNSGIGGTDSISVAPGCGLANMPDIIPPNRDGCTFEGYYSTSQTSGGTKYYDSTGEAVRGGPSSAITLYARWKAAITYEVETPVSVYCTNQAEVASSTSSALAVTISTSGSSSVNTVIHTESLHSWVVSSDGRTVTIPSGTSANTYSYTIHLSVPANTATSGGYLGNTLDVSGSINLLAVTATYGNLIQNDTGIEQTNDFPASQITISTSNIANYFNDPGTCTQVVSYSNGTVRSGTVTRAWSGTSKTLSSLGTTPTSRQSVSINTWTLKFTGEGNKTWSESVSTGYRSANTVTYGTPVISHDSPISMPAGGGTYTLQPTVSQSVTWTSGSSSTLTNGTFTYDVITSKTGYSLNASTGVVTVTNNASTTARNGFYVGIHCTMNGVAASTKSVKFEQPAGEIQYDTPEIDSFTYTQFPATGGTGSPTVTFHQGYTWNGVPDMNSGVVTTGGAYQYSTTGTLPDGFSTNTNYALNGSVGWGNNMTSNPRSAASNLRVRVTVNGLTSAYKTCDLCSQAAGVIEYGTPEVTAYSYAQFSAAGGTKTPTVSYSVTYTWNGVAGSGGTATTGGTLTFTAANNLPSYATPGSDFSTTGSITYASRGTVQSGTTLNVKNYLSVIVTFGNVSSSSFTCTSCLQKANYRTWSNPVISHTTPVSLSAAGQTYAMSPTMTQTATYDSGATEEVTTGATYAYEVKTSQTGYSLSSNNVTVTNNTSTSARNGFVVTITCTGNGSKTSTKDITFNQEAGSKVYGTPTVTAYTYSTFPASGATYTPTIGYSITWTWNGVSGSGGTETQNSGVSYVTQFGAVNGETVTSGFTKGDTYSSTGTMIAEDRGDTPGSARSTHAALRVRVTTRSNTSSWYTCTSCTQEANELTWGNLGSITHTTPVSLTAAGETYAMSPTIAAQIGTYTSGSTTTYNPTFGYAVKTAKTGFSLSSNNVTVTNNESTSAREGFVVTITATGNGSKTATKDITFNQAAGAKVYGTPVVSAYTYSTSVSAAGTTDLAPASCTCKHPYTWNNVSNSGGEDTYTLSSSGITWTFTNSGSISYVTSGTDFSTTGKINVASRGSTIGNAQDFYSALSVVATIGGTSSASKTATAGKQVGNYVTAVAPRASGATTHFIYADISAGATSAPVTLKGASTYTYTSGATTTSAPSTTYGSATYARTYTLETVQNGFTAVAADGTLTATNRGTETGAARTSGNVTSKLTVTFTHKSGYGGTSVSGTLTQSTTCTQGANTLTWGNLGTITCDTPVTVPAAGQSNIAISPTITAQTGTYTSGSTTTYTPTFTYAQSAAVTGFSLSSNKVTAANNNTTSARSYTVVVTANGKTGTNSTYETGFNKTATKSVVFNQAAGAKVYANPVVTGYSYADFSAGGATSQYPTVTYEQSYTWNDTGTSTTDSYTYDSTHTSPGGSLAFTFGSSAGFSTGTSFATSGRMTAENRATTSGAARDAKSALSVIVTLNSKSSTSFTCTSCKQAANTLTWEDLGTITCDTPVTVPVTGEANMTMSPSIGTQTGTYTSGSTVSFTPTFTYAQSAAVSGFTLSSNKVTATNNTSASAKTYTVVITATGKPGTDSTYETGYGKTTTKNVVFNQAAGSKVYANPVVTGYSYDTVGASAASSRYPTVTYTQSYTWNGIGSSTTDSYTYDSSHTSPGGSRAFTNSGAYSWATNGTSFATSGRVTFKSRGTTIGNERDAADALSVIVTVNGLSSESFTCTSAKQVGNYLVSITPAVSSGYDSHFTYDDIGPGATSASPVLHGTATYIFTSGGSTTTKPTTTYGTGTYSRVYSISPVQNGFTAVNETTGVLTATSYGTTVGPDRVSGTVTGVLTVTFVHSANYSAGGTVTSPTLTTTATCTQTANALVSLSLTTGSNSITFGSSTTGTVKATYTSGANQDVTSSSSFTTDPDDIVEIT